MKTLQFYDRLGYAVIVKISENKQNKHTTLFCDDIRYTIEKIEENNFVLMKHEAILFGQETAVFVARGYVGNDGMFYSSTRYSEFTRVYIDMIFSFAEMIVLTQEI